MGQHTVLHGRRVERVERRLDRRIDELEARLYRRISDVDVRLDRLDMRGSKLYDGLTVRALSIARTIEDSAGRRGDPTSHRH